MATVVQSAYAITEATSPATLTLASNVTAGNTLILAIGWAGGGGAGSHLPVPTDANGTYLTAVAPGLNSISCAAAIYYEANITGGVKHVTTVQGQVAAPDNNLFVSCALYEVSGLTGTPLDKTSSATTVNGGSGQTLQATGSTGVLSQANEFAFVMCEFDSNPGVTNENVGVPSGYTVDPNIAGFNSNQMQNTLTNQGLQVGWKEISATTALNPSFTLPGTDGGLSSMYAAIATFEETSVSALIGDGTSTGATSASTGTNGGVMPAITIGQQLPVIVFIRSSTLPGSLTVSDGSNNYQSGAGQFGSIDLFNDSANGCIWYLFACTVVTAITSPIITVTAQAGYFPTSMSIAAIALNNISLANPAPFTAGNVAHASNLFSGANQLSGFTPNLAGGLGVNYTLVGFALDQGNVNAVQAPAVGSGFTQIGTAFSALSSGGTTPTLLIETQQIQGGTFPVQASAVYVSGRAYTLAAVFNNFLLPISPSGPMPRQLYIMP